MIFQSVPNPQVFSSNAWLSKVHINRSAPLNESYLLQNMDKSSILVDPGLCIPFPWINSDHWCDGILPWLPDSHKILPRSSIHETLYLHKRLSRSETFGLGQLHIKGLHHKIHTSSYQWVFVKIFLCCLFVTLCLACLWIFEILVFFFFFLSLQNLLTYSDLVCFKNQKILKN